MKKYIKIEKIRTNNLKGFDISIPYNKITVITGVSGGGKSSLAYSTLYNLSKLEFNSLENGYLEEPTYEIGKFEGLMPIIAIKQNNFNSNPRSTLYSYLNISSLLSIEQKYNLTNIPMTYLKLNKKSNECPNCKGLGVVDEIDLNKIIDNQKSITEMPFDPWRQKNNDKYQKLLMAFCKEKKIDINIPFSLLSEKDKKDILYSNNDVLYEINYKYSSKYKRKKISYTGVLKEIQDSLKSEKSSDVKYAQKYCTSKTCLLCNGARIDNNVYKNIKYSKVSFNDLLTKSIDELLLNKEICQNKYINSTRFIILLKSISNMGLGYLSLSRSIPSLSGGELQKINFCKMKNTNISNIGIILDEISEQVHVSDYKKLFDELTLIKERNNTIILVEHNDYFVSRAEKKIIIGGGAGAEGGYLLDEAHTWKPDINIGYSSPTNFFKISSINKNNVKNLTINIPIGKTTVLVGRAGAGKSSIANYINENNKDVSYISQKTIRGNIRSTLASYLELNNTIATWFSKEFKTQQNVFLLTSQGSAVCKSCDGTGVIRYDRGYDASIETVCPDCHGKLFGCDVKSYLYQDLTIEHLYNTNLDSVEKSWSPIKKLCKIASIARELSLGHLTLNRKIKSLSGGELRRLKLLKTLVYSRSKILIIDELGSGLDNYTAEKITKFIKNQVKNDKLIIIIDHKPSVFLNADYLIEIGPGSGENGGKINFSGSPFIYYEKYYQSYL
jgi:excinuclease UvrABC ATPase subunit